MGRASAFSPGPPERSRAFQRGRRGLVITFTYICQSWLQKKKVVPHLGDLVGLSVLGLCFSLNIPAYDAIC